MHVFFLIASVLWAYIRANDQFMNIRDTLHPIILKLIEAGHSYSAETYNQIQLLSFLTPAKDVPLEVVRHSVLGMRLVSSDND